MKRSFIGDTVNKKRKSEDGFRENSTRTGNLYYRQYEPRYWGRIYKKSLYGIHNEQFKRSGFYELAKKSEKVEPVNFYFQKTYKRISLLGTAG
ncbi:MAG: hypothetical protein V8Q93_15110 [Blautia faecis]